MRLMNLESHFFSTQPLSISEQEIHSFIQKFIPFQIYPQVFNETDSVGNNKQQFMFINPLDGKQALFMDNKISFITTYGENNFSHEDLLLEHEKFIDFISNIISGYHSIRTTTVYNRLSYIIRYANIKSYDDELNHLNETLIPSLSWGDSTKIPSDFGINLGYREDLDKEKINNLTRIFIGSFQNIGPHGISSEHCFLKEIDINTIEENNENRFSFDSAIDFVTKLKKIAHEKVKSLESK